MLAAIRIIITILMLAAEIAGSIICFLNIYKSPCEILLIWCLATIIAIIMWTIFIDMYME